jgi:hypothetical protein
VSDAPRTGWEGAEKWFRRDTGDAPGEGGEPPAPEPEEAGPPRCEVCGAELDHDQTYCLECGSPTPLAPRLRRGRKGMAALAGAVALLGLGAGALAYAVADDDGEVSVTNTAPTAPVIPGTVPLPPETAPTIGTLPPDTSLGTVPPPVTDIPPATQTGFDTVTGPGTTPTTPTEPATTTGTTTEATTEAPPATTDQVPSAGGDSDWPPGRTAWTAILSSVRSEPDARAAKRELIAQGEQAGILPSDDFADLRPGYWVVFSGIFSDRDQAIARASSLRGEYPSAYARRLEG